MESENPLVDESNHFAEYYRTGTLHQKHLKFDQMEIPILEIQQKIELWIQLEIGRGLKGGQHRNIVTFFYQYRDVHNIFC